IRENSDPYLRIYRERKTVQSLPWPLLAGADRKSSDAVVRGGDAHLQIYARDYWNWVCCGPSEERPDLWFRFEPFAWEGFHSRERGFAGLTTSVRMNGAPPSRVTSGVSIHGISVIDEGDLFTGTRTRLTEADVGPGLTAEALREYLGTDVL